MIGVFDSGIGGLTVVKAIMDRLPGYDIVYFGDTARTPYGSKDPETVIRYALEDCQILIGYGVQMIIVACNTVSSVAMDSIYRDVNIPVFEVITPAARLAAQTTRFGRIGVIGTRATISSRVYETQIRRINPDATVWSSPSPLLVPLVEEGWIKKPETRMIVKKYLIPLKTRQIDTLVLGCTHYPVLKPIIQEKAGKRVQVIDSSNPVAESVENYLEAHPEISRKLPRNDRIQCLVSSVTDQFQKMANKIIGKQIQLKLI